MDDQEARFAEIIRLAKQAASGGVVVRGHDDPRRTSPLLAIPLGGSSLVPRRSACRRDRKRTAANGLRDGVRGTALTLVGVGAGAGFGSSGSSLRCATAASRSV